MEAILLKARESDSPRNIGSTCINAETIRNLKIEIIIVIMFWNIRDAGTVRNQVKLATVSTETEWEIIKCPKYGWEHQHGGHRLTNLGIILPDRVPDDFVWTWASDCIIGRAAL